MSGLPPSKELLPLLNHACNGTLAQAQTQQLASVLESDAVFREAFVQHIRLRTNIRLLGRAEKASDAGLARVRTIAAQLPEPSSFVPSFLSTAYHGTIGFFSQELPFSLLIATVLTGFGLWIASLVYVSTPAEIAGSKTSSPLPQPFSMTTRKVVGKITGLVDCKWNGGSCVSLGQKCELASGLMEITYDTGAKVILQGPVTYEVESNGGYLSVGKLTGKLEKKVAGGQWPVARKSDDAGSTPSLTTDHWPLTTSSNPQSLIPNPFVIRTPTATVTDLGTEFGVEVSKEGSTTSHVFRGSVKVQMISADGAVEGNARVLHENQSARVEKDTNHPTNANRITVFASSANFVREIPMRESPFAAAVKMFDLVDVVAGGNGFSGNRGASIDPTTGRRSVAVEFGNPKVEALFPKGDNKYHRVEELPFVDGVFVPDGSVGPVQVDSAGHVFADFPKTTNQTALLIRAGGAVPTVRWAIPTTLDGVDYAQQGHGLLFLHPNKGITFDLNAIRKGNSGWIITRFLAVAGNTETVSGGGGSAYADFWVLVDGQMQFRRCQITAYGSGFSISIPIKSTDRFLTLASTDGGDGLSTDWIMFGDPRLELIEASGQQSPQNSSTKGGQ